MANQMATIDPLGRIIYLLPDIFFIQNPENDIYDDATTVIKKTCYDHRDKRKKPN